MAKSWECVHCGEAVSELGAYVKLSSFKYAHWPCQEEMCLNAGIEQGRAQVLAEQAEQQAARIRADLEAQEKAVAERAKAQALAQENARNEAARLKALTMQAQEAIKREQQGEARERMTLIELPEPGEQAALDGARAEREAKEQARVAALETCVRCKTKLDPPDPSHPRHCHRCWMDEGTGQGAKLADVDKIEDQVKEALKRGVRPLEID